MPSSTPRLIVAIIVGTLCTIALIGVVSLSLTLFYKTYVDPTILTSFIALTTASIGTVSGLLANTRQPSGTNGATATTSTMTTTTTPHPIATTNDPVPVQVVNQPQDPVPTTEEKKP